MDCTAPKTHHIAQATVLMLFQDADSLPYADIASSTGIEAGELKRTLQSLACGKVCSLWAIICCISCFPDALQKRGSAH